MAKVDNQKSRRAFYNWFVVNVWRDSVWSKVLGAIVFAIGAKVYAAFESIPFWELIIRPLGTVHFTFNILTIFLFAISVVAAYYFLSYIAKKKRPLKIRSDIHQFLHGNWTLYYTIGATTEIEHLTISPGDKYYSGDSVPYVVGNNLEFNYYTKGVLEFRLSNALYDEERKELRWAKVRESTASTYSWEKLQIEDDDNIKGTDNKGFSLHYVREDSLKQLKNNNEY